MDTHQFTFINGLVDNFYEFMGSVYIEHKNKVAESELALQIASTIPTTPTTPTKPTTPTIIETPTETIITIDENITPNIPIIPKPQSFGDYFLFNLFYHYGIKRRMVNEHIALLYYSKTAKGYKPNEPITILCRHMLLDMRYMRIISLGIPKAVKLDDFCNTYNIDKTKSTTNLTSDFSGNNEVPIIPKFRLYKFPEGTMITYNPSLKNYNITPITSVSELNVETDELNVETDEMDVEMPVEMHNIDLQPNELQEVNLGQEHSNDSLSEDFNKKMMFSTRRVIGTSNFNSMKSFMEMFEENNKIANTNLDAIPEDIIKDTVLVFNIEHPENKIISSHLRNFNTLCAVFKFKSELVSQSEYSNIALADSDFTIRESFKYLGTNMVTQIQVPIYNKTLLGLGLNINFHLPEVITNFANTTKSYIKYSTLSIDEIDNIVKNRSKDFQGFIMYGLNGERTKISNQKYKDLKDLKGNKPIVIEQWNMKNLFYLYWKLVKDNKVDQFIAEFDMGHTTNTTLTTKNSYKQLFNWFSMLARKFALDLFRTYHYSFVKKTINKPDIPFALKPLCGDLHNQYKANKTPISQTMVELYVFEQPANKIFWRIFLCK